MRRRSRESTLQESSTTRSWLPFVTETATPAAFQVGQPARSFNAAAAPKSGWISTEIVLLKARIFQLRVGWFSQLSSSPSSTKSLTPANPNLSEPHSSVHHAPCKQPTQALVAKATRAQRSNTKISAAELPSRTYRLVGVVASTPCHHSTSWAA